MAGQDATLSLEAARKQMERTEHTVSDHQGKKSTTGSGGIHTDICKKVKHQG